MTTYYIFRINGSHTLTMPAEVANYIHNAVCDTVTTEGLALRLWEKANPAMHASSFDRASLREVLRIVTGRSEYHKILHHWHASRNVSDINSIGAFAVSLKKAIDNRAFRVIVK